MKVSKWGNSLAVRIPADVATELQLKEGDEIELRRGESQVIELVRAASRRERIEKLREILKDTLPEDSRFNREDANARR